MFTCRAATAAKSLQSCLTLCDPIDGSPPGSPVPGILPARTLEWDAISFSNAWKWKVKSESEVVQLCPTLSDPMDCSLPGSSVHGIFQARVLEWGAIAFSVTCREWCINSESPKLSTVMGFQVYFYFLGYAFIHCMIFPPRYIVENKNKNWFWSTPSI